MNGAEALAERIVARGARSIFGLAGVSHTPLLFALEDRGVAVVGARHETGAVGAADGYARVTGGIGFAFTIAEQGLQNAISGIATASQAGTPLVLIVTRFPDGLIEADADYVADQHDLVMSITKWRRTVPSADRLCDYFDAACRRALEGRPGPVVLTVPLGQFNATVTPPPLPPADPPARGSAALIHIAEAAALLAASSHPLIIADTAAAIDKAGPALERLAAAGIPVLGNNLGRGLVPEDGGMGHDWPLAQPMAAKADLILVAGSRLDMWLGFGMPPRFNPAAKVIHVDRTEGAIGRNRPVDCALVGDIAAILDDLANALGDRRFDPAWLNDAVAARRDRFAQLAEANTLHTTAIGVAVEAKAPADRILVGDGADTQSFMHALLTVRRPRSYMDQLPMGSMGIGLPLAIGAACAARDLAAGEGGAVRRTILTTGDGSLGFYLGELDTARRERLALTVLVNNDAAWGTEYHAQRLAFGRASNTKIDGCDYGLVARGLGCDAWTVDDRAALEAALDAALKLDGPALIDVHVDPDSGLVRKTDPDKSTIVFDEIGGQRLAIVRKTDG